jgi:hypothetical protein
MDKCLPRLEFRDCRDALGDAPKQHQQTEICQVENARRDRNGCKVQYCAGNFTGAHLTGVTEHSA